MQKSTKKAAVDRNSVTYVVETLREKIASNELQQDTKLRELELAKNLDVSRQVIRDAFTILQQRGLVVRIPNRGAFVARYSYHEMMDLYDIRESLTILSYKLAARRAPDGAWADLTIRFGKPMESVVKDRDVKTFSDAIVELDNCAASFASNKFLDPMLDRLTDLTQVLVRRAMLLPNRLELGLEHNRMILRALAERDENEVEKVFCEMMRVSREYLTKYREILF